MRQEQKSSKKKGITPLYGPTYQACSKLVLEFGSQINGVMLQGLIHGWGSKNGIKTLGFCQGYFFEISFT